MLLKINAATAGLDERSASMAFEACREKRLGGRRFCFLLRKEEPETKSESKALSCRGFLFVPGGAQREREGACQACEEEAHQLRGTAVSISRLLGWCFEKRSGWRASGLLESSVSYLWYVSEMIHSGLKPGLRGLAWEAGQRDMESNVESTLAATLGQGILHEASLFKAWRNHWQGSRMTGTGGSCRSDLRPRSASWRCKTVAESSLMGSPNGGSFHSRPL